MPSHCWMVEKIDERRLARCRKEVQSEMLAAGWHTYDGKFVPVSNKKAMQRYRGTK